MAFHINSRESISHFGNLLSFSLGASEHPSWVTIYCVLWDLPHLPGPIILKMNLEAWQERWNDPIPEALFFFFRFPVFV